MEKLLTVREAAELMKISRSSLYRYCERNIIPHIKKSFGLRFRREELEEWLEQDKREATLSENILKNALTNSTPVVIDRVKGGRRKLAKKSQTCFNYGFGRVYVRTYRSGHSCWTIDFRDENGKRIQKALPNVQSREEAAFILSKKVAEVFDGKHGIERKKQKI